MSLSLLLDEHISATVVAQIQSKRPEIRIQSIYWWREGVFAGEDDAPLLAAAADESLTLVTYDQRTIFPLLSQMGLAGGRHGGVLFIDDKTIPSSDIGAIVLALIAFWDRCRAWEWQDRIAFLQPVAD